MHELSDGELKDLTGAIMERNTIGWRWGQRIIEARGEPLEAEIQRQNNRLLKQSRPAHPR